MKHKSVCILGGTGFVGRHLVARLNAMGKRVRVLTRYRERHRELLVLPLVEIIQADIHDREQLKNHFAEMDAVINLVGILNERGHRGEGFQEVHVNLSRKVLEACQKTGVHRLLHMSALQAEAANAPSFYLRSKGEAENHVHTFSSAVKVTSFRPSVIFGEEDSFFNRFAALLKFAPGLFPLACPNARFAPVYIGDVADAIADALDNRSAVGQRIDLCGPTVYTLKQLVEYTAHCMGLNTKVIGLPDFIAQLQAFVMEYFMPGKPFSLDNYKSLQVDGVCKKLNKNATAIETIVPHYINNHDDNNGYTNYRSHARRSK